MTSPTDPTAAPHPSTPSTAPTATRPAAPDDVAQLRLLITRLGRRLRQTSADITSSQMSALSIIDHFGQITVSDLAGYENVQPPTISRIVSSLEKVGWVERVADPTDRRVVLVRTTAKATRELARLREERDAYLARRLAALDPDEVDAIVAALPALEHLLREDDDR